MNAPKLFILLCCCFVSIDIFAQTPKAIEVDLYKSFKKIDYSKEDNTEANDLFGKKLKYYTSKFPHTINQKFLSLSNAGIAINCSDDGQLRIYSWDTFTGGTMHYFANVIQYKTRQKTNSILDRASGESEKYIYGYSDLYDITINNRTYYIALYYGVFSGKDKGKGIRIFSIEKEKLVDGKLIKTKSGLHSKLYYSYDLFSIPKNVKDADILYDPVLKTISLPVIVDVGRVTNKRILYKFTGQYFEKVKS